MEDLWRERDGLTETDDKAKGEEAEVAAFPEGTEELEVEVAVEEGEITQAGPK